MRHYCYDQIYLRKQDNINMFRYKNVRDEDLFIDFKLDLSKEKEVAVFESMCNPKMPGDMDTLEKE